MLKIIEGSIILIIRNRDHAGKFSHSHSFLFLKKLPIALSQRGQGRAGKTP